MKKYLFIVLCCYSLFLYGQDVSEALAVEVASNYYERVKYDNANRIEYQQGTNRTSELISPLGKAGMWLVPVPDGWVLVSTNTRTVPILAHYQANIKPVYDSLAPAEQFLLNWYEEAIALANNTRADYVRHEKWTTLMQKQSLDSISRQGIPIVQPMLSVHWAQSRNASGADAYCDKSYNKYCPYVYNPDKCNKAVVGCVAVAIAQIMQYWQWPYAALVPTTPGGSTTDLRFYDWNKMPDFLDNTSPMDEVDMVTGFLRDCGYMADMDYGVSSSASDGDAEDALISFGYNEESISLHYKWLTSGWSDMLQAELNAGRPVYYGGMETFFGGDGHAFVVDGYDSWNMYHINFGWGKIGGTFYDLDEVNYNDTTSYNYWQVAIVGIQPQPICMNQPLTGWTPPSKFSLVGGGDITLYSCTFSNIQQGQIFSSTKVTLKPGTSIQSGSNVQIAIRPVPCSNRNSIDDETMGSDTTTISVLQHQNLPARLSNTTTSTTALVQPNPAEDWIMVQTDGTLDVQSVAVFDYSGRCVLQTTETNIDVGNLPSGMYIIRVYTADGQTLQSKFVHK